MSDRKYRQSGYQESDSRERRGSRDRRGPSGPRGGPQGPRGRGLGKPTATVFRCAVCGYKGVVAEVTAEASCAKCRADLHTCTHCVHFDSSAPNECRQPVETPISSKAKRNACPVFEPRTTREFAADTSTPSSAKAAFDALFD